MTSKAALALLVLCACQPVPAAQSAATTTPTDATPPATAESATGPSKCRDWSDLDLATLPALPASPYTATFEQVWRTVLAKHYDPTLGCLDWPAQRLRYGQEIAKAADTKAAYAVMNKLLGELGQSHLAVVPPRASTEGEPRGGERMGAASVPVRVRLVDGEVVIVDAAVHGQRSGLPPGAVIVAVEGREVAPVVEETKAIFDREVEVGFRVAQAVGAWLTCEPGAKRSVTFVAAPGKKPQTKKATCREWTGERMTLGNIKDIPVEVEHRMLPGKVGVVRFNVWMVPLVAKIEAAVVDLRKQGMRALVLDLRGNPGGVGAMVVPVARLLLAQSGSLGVMRMREAEQKFAVTAGDDPFAGPVAILVDEGTGSTSEIFAQALHDLGRVKVFGAGPSQGAALPSLIEMLDGGAILQYVVADYTSPGGGSVEGKGVVPDVVVDETSADFRAGKDPVLAAAVAALTAGEGAQP